MIPEGWQSVPLADIAKSKIVYGIVQAGPHDPTGVPYLKSSDIGGQIDCSSLQRTAPEIHQRFARSTVVPGDIVISLRGNIGDTSIVPDELAEANLTQGTARISVAEDFDRDFVFFQLASFDVQRRIHSVTKGSTFVEITLEDLRKIEIPVPQCRRQQRYIADLFLDWNHAIETVEALIANACAQKQALMQQLLPQGTTPPKKRLPGFSGEWREVSLGSLGETYGGLTGKSKNDFGSGSPFITYKNVFENSFVDPKNVERVRIEAGERQHLIRNGDILFTTSSETPEEVGMSSVVTFDASAIYLNSFCFGFRPNSGNSIRPHFAGNFFRSPSMRRQIAALAQGSTRYNISKSALLKLTFQLPDAEEQDAIADIFGGCDAELLKLTGQLTALRQEKAALMQQLLTGKRRVKLPESEVA